MATAAAAAAEFDPDAEQKRLLEIFKEIDEDGNQTLEREGMQHLAERKEG